MMEHKIKFDRAEMELGPLGNFLRLHILHETGPACALCDEISANGKVYQLTAKPYNEHRSLSANAYCWVLCEKIAKATSTKDATVTKEEVYRNAIKRVGVFNIVTVAETALETLERHWQSNGTGWIVDSLGESTEGFVDVAVYYGSSSYDKAEMGRLLDDLIEDAKALGIETESPDEIARIKSLWGE